MKKQEIFNSQTFIHNFFHFHFVSLLCFTQLFGFTLMAGRKSLGKILKSTLKCVNKYSFFFRRLKYLLTETR